MFNAFIRRLCDSGQQEREKNIDLTTSKEFTKATKNDYVFCA
jgi:hypothetical protein